MQNMVLDNMRLAYKIAWDFHGCGIEQEELEGFALLGLVKAASSFDRSKGFKFTTFAVPVIRNEILMEIRKISRFKNSVSLDAENPDAGGEGKYTLLDLLPYEEEGFDRVDDSDLLPSLFKQTSLRDRERRAITLVILNGNKQADVGREMGVTQSAVCRYVKSGVNKIRREYWKEMRELA